MSSRRRATLATLAGSVANTVIVSVQAVVLIPLYLHFIGPSLYGAWLGSGDVLVWLQAFDLGLPNLMIQRIGAAHSRGDKSAVGMWLAAGLLVLGVLSAAVFVIGLVVAPALPRLVHIAGQEGEQLVACFSVAALASSAILFNNAFVGFARGVQATEAMNVAVTASALVGFATSFVLVMSGWGLWAIAIGMVARAGVALTSSILLIRGHVKSGMVGPLDLRSDVLREFAAVGPATGLGGVSYIMMNQSDVFLVAMALGPTVAAAYSITRKAADVGRSVLDTVGAATYGAFAHLVGTASGERSLQVHQEISAVRFGAAVVFASIFVAVNAPLVVVWVGQPQYAGDALTYAFAVQLVVVGGSYLVNYLYRASGHVVAGSWALVIEAMVRVPIMAALVLWLGAVGAPVAAAGTAAISWWILWRRTALHFGMRPGLGSGTPRASWVGRVLVLVGGAAATRLPVAPTWGHVALLASAVGVFGAVVVYATDCDLRSAIKGALAAVRSSSAGGRHS